MENQENQSSGMTVDKLYDHITKVMTPEAALKKLLSSSLRTYEKLKFPEGTTPVHPIFIMSFAAMDMGWDFLVPDGPDDDDVNGLIVGTSEYVDRITFRTDKTNEK
jgi:hypothetical protein